MQRATRRLECSASAARPSSQGCLLCNKKARHRRTCKGDCGNDMCPYVDQPILLCEEHEYDPCPGGHNQHAQQEFTPPLSTITDSTVISTPELTKNLLKALQRTVGSTDQASVSSLENQPVASSSSETPCRKRAAQIFYQDTVQPVNDRLSEFTGVLFEICDDQDNTDPNEWLQKVAQQEADLQAAIKRLQEKLAEISPVVEAVAGGMMYARQQQKQAPRVVPSVNSAMSDQSSVENIIPASSSSHMLDENLLEHYRKTHGIQYNGFSGSENKKFWCTKCKRQLADLNAVENHVKATSHGQKRNPDQPVGKLKQSTRMEQEKTTQHRQPMVIPLFHASKRFCGPKTGYVFKMGELGLGYYIDNITRLQGLLSRSFKSFLKEALADA